MKNAWEMNCSEFCALNHERTYFKSDKELEDFVIKNATKKSGYGKWFNVDETRYYIDSSFSGWDGIPSITKLINNDYPVHYEIIEERLKNGLFVSKHAVEQYKDLIEKYQYNLA